MKTTRIMAPRVAFGRHTHPGEEIPPGDARGGDVDSQGDGTITGQRLYQPIRQPKPIVDRQFTIEFLGAGAEAFAFTFG